MGTAVATAPQPTRARKFTKLWRDGDQIAHLVTFLFAASVFLVTVFLVYELWIHSGPSRAKFGFSFLTGKVWDPVAEQFGALPFIYGTVLTSLIALVISVPLGVGAAIFLSELAPPTFQRVHVPGRVVGSGAQRDSWPAGRIHAGTPHAPIRRTLSKESLGSFHCSEGPPTASGYLTAGLILAVMTFPFIISISREALLAVPREQREAALARGATNGSPLGRPWSCPMPGWELSDRFFWRSPGRSVKLWRSPW